MLLIPVCINGERLTVKIEHRSIVGRNADEIFVYSAAQYAKDIEGRQPELNATWSDAMSLDKVMEECKSGSAADRAAVLVGLRMLGEVPELHVQPEGYECGCTEAVSSMIVALGTAEVRAEFESQRQMVWREMQGGAHAEAVRSVRSRSTAEARMKRQAVVKIPGL
jgi:hypothetical protein